MTLFRIIVSILLVFAIRMLIVDSPWWELISFFVSVLFGSMASPYKEL